MTGKLTSEEIAEANQSRDLWFWDPSSENAYFIPQGWLQEIPDPFPEDGRTIYGYAPTHVYKNSPVDTLFILLDELASCEVIDEQTARARHENLARFLDAVNAGQDPHASQIRPENR